MDVSLSSWSGTDVVEDVNEDRSSSSWLDKKGSSLEADRGAIRMLEQVGYELIQSHSRETCRALSRLTPNLGLISTSSSSSSSGLCASLFAFRLPCLCFGGVESRDWAWARTSDGPVE